jgi:hypothetical protein
MERQIGFFDAIILFILRIMGLVKLGCSTKKDPKKGVLST